MRCGVIAGPLFIFIVLIQDYTRSGYDPRRELISLLSLGNLGWIQITNFVICGILNLCYAIGLRKTLRYQPGGTWAPILIGAYGFGLIMVGVCVTDPSGGYPQGSIRLEHPSWHGAIHALGGLFVFVVLTALIAVFARVFAAYKEYAWAIGCSVTAMTMPALFFGSFSSAALTARLLRLATALGWAAVSVIAMKLSQKNIAASAPVNSIAKLETFLKEKP